MHEGIDSAGAADIDSSTDRVESPKSLFIQSIQDGVNALTPEDYRSAGLSREDKDWVRNVLPIAPIHHVSNIDRLASPATLQFLKDKGIVTDEVIAQAVQLKEKRLN